MEIITLQLGPLGTNCYLIVKGAEALIIDPGGNADEVITRLQNLNASPKAILLTHAHFDHIGAVEVLRNHFHIDVYLHRNENDWLQDPNLNRSTFFIGEEISAREPDKLLEPGKMEIGKFRFEVAETPGHSPGSVSFIFKELAFVISGDVLFQHSIGRTDLPGGDFQQLEASIRNILYSLPDHFQVFAGHGLMTTIGEEKKNNPFVPFK
ncbi:MULTISPECIES: MBL fold metallo-hydrolase [unclassified Virgibacillus]|uniref:MBL fold metallo-hydrolase n=1 Tax=unclassified Virgibacillus TaxID=2620237 RepID=UPI0024DEFF67|nr:MBL fold metallo-hydrolase [Virgibacillus sp. LDC-1]